MPIKAQTLYDLQERYHFVSGEELSEFFRQQGLHPYPSGYEEIDQDQALDFLRDSLNKLAWNNGGESPYLPFSIARMEATVIGNHSRISRNR